MPNRSAATTQPPTKVGKPHESHVSLTGVERRKVKLRVPVLAGSNAPALAEIAVILPRGLRFNMSGLARGVIITAQAPNDASG